MNSLTMRGCAATLVLLVLSCALSACASGGDVGNRDGGSAVGTARRGLSTDDALARVQPRR